MHFKTFLWTVTTEALRGIGSLYARRVLFAKEPIRSGRVSIFRYQSRVF